jgi:hypothetical protein
LKPQTIEGREKNPKKNPGPQEYFKEDKFDGRDKKTEVFKREKGEKRIYKPNMNNHVF